MACDRMDTTGRVSRWRSIINAPWGASLLMILPSLLLLLIFYFYPLLRLLPQSVCDNGYTLKHFRHFFEDQLYLDTFLRTLQICIIASLVNLLMGYPVAYLLANVKPKLAGVLLIFIVVPFWTSILVRTYSWIVLLQRNGLINKLLLSLHIINEPIRLMYTQFAVTIGMVHILLPFMILPIYSVIKGIDPNLTLAAMSMGASPRKAFFKVTLPMSIPGIAAGILLVFIQSLGFYVTPMLLGGPQTLMVSGLIDRQMFTFLNWPFGSAISLVLLIVTVLFMIGFDHLFGLDTLQQKMV